jgi:hypothetical protein
LPVEVRIVDHRREEVEGLDEGDLVGEAVDPRVVVRLGADEEVGVVDLG